MSLPALSSSSHFRVGSFFVFAAPSAFQETLYSWLRHVPGLKLPQGGSVLSLFGREPLRLPGARIESSLARLQLGTVTPDRDLYRQDRDAVRLLVVDPLNPGARATVEVLLQGAVCQSESITLDPNGAGLLELQGLTAGDYQVRLQGQTQTASLTVAEYRLVPLVAMLVEQRRQGQELGVTVRLESFGQPLEGKVRVDLMDRNRRLESQELTCAEGLLQGFFQLAGEGPHSLSFQRQDRTASLALPGTRRQERELTLFSTLGHEVQGSLLPAADSTEVRGLHLAPGALRNAPLSLERLDTGRARLVANTRCENVRALMLDPTCVRSQDRPAPPNLDATPSYWLGLQQFQQGEFEPAVELFRKAYAEHPDAWVAHYLSRALAGAGEVQEARAWLKRAGELGWLLSQEEQSSLSLAPREEMREVMEPGEALELDVPSPLGVLAVGCYVESRPWEGWAAVVRPAEFSAGLTAPATAEPGQEVELALDVPEQASVFLLVRDSRLTRQDSPESALAARLKSFVADLPPRSTQIESAPVQLAAPPGAQVRRRGLVPSSGAARPGLMAGRVGSSGDKPTLGRWEQAAWDAPAGFAMGASGGEDLFGASSFGAPAGPLFEAPAMPSFANGVADFFAKAPPRPTTQGEAEVLLARLSRGSMRCRLQVPRAMGDFLVEAFVLHGRDWRTLRQRLRVVSDLHVELDVPPCVFPGDAVTGRVLLVGEAAVRLTRDGQEVALGPDLSFPVEPGHYRVEAGPRVAEADVCAPGKLRRRLRSVQLMRAGEVLERTEGILGWTVLPNCDRPLETLVEATTNYAHCCCEQTSTKMLAAATALALARDPARQSQARAALRLGLDRLESMWVSGRGFCIYPGHSMIHEHWSRQAALNLRALRKLSDDPRVIDLDDRVGRVYPDLQEHGLAGRFWHLPAEAETALAEARRFLSRPPGPNRVEWRHQAAFAVAILVRAGCLEEALPVANAITADLNQQGMLYSTHDSVAALAMFGELSRSGMLNGDAKVEAEENRLRVLEGLATVQVDRVVEEDWSQLSFAVGLRVWWEPRRLQAGQAVDLHVELEDGYEMGDLVYVNLPACLSRLTGGGQVKQFAVDFEGRSKLTIPLVATSPGSQHFTLCVRNMFDEERAGSPGMLQVEVQG